MSGIIQAIAGYPTVVADFHTKCINLDGSTEYLANTTDQAIGIANAWTIQDWFETDADLSSSALADYLFSIRQISDAVPNFIGISARVASRTFDLSVYGSNGTSYKSYNFTYTASTKYCLQLTFDGTNLKVYRNGTELTTGGGTLTKANDDSITMTDTNRSWAIGASPGSASNWNWKGKQCRMDIWNTALSSTELTALYDSGNGYKLDVRNSYGNYTSTSALKHQQALGKDSGLTTSDYVSSGTVDVYANASNISAADIETF